jgi:hypothetical protein
MTDEAERYDEEEVGLILHRAAEIQAGRSMTLDELEAAAAEAGIDRALVRRAAVEVRQRREPPPVAMPGVFGPLRLRQERRIVGTLGAANWEDIVAEIRRHLGLDGGAESLGKELVWRSKKNPAGGGRDVRVSIVRRRGQTLIEVEERAGGLAGGLYGGIMGGGFGAGVAWILPVCIAALGAPVLIPVFLAAWVVATWYLARRIQRPIMQARAVQLHALADGLEELGQELAVHQGDEPPVE